jgi:hypothetical protein
MENIHNQAIPAEALGEAQKRISEVAEVLAPYLLNLTPAKRKGMAKMGDKSLAFVTKARELARQNESLYPSYMDIADFDIDLTDATQLLNINNSLQQVQKAVDDTAMIAGSEAYQTALLFYTSVKTAAEKNVAGAQAVYDELKVRFPHIRRKKEAPASENIT